VPVSQRNKLFDAACGEFYVSAYLSRRELFVALPRAGIQNIDLFVASDASKRHIGIQVKTTPNAYGKDKAGEYLSWVQSYPADDNIGRPDLWYAYVNLNDWLTGQDQPDIYFIPSVGVMKRMHELRESDPKPWREHFWMFVDAFLPYKNEAGFALLKDAMMNPV
jgi:hypothetical protein